MDNSEQRNNAPNLKTAFFEEVAVMLESSKTPKWYDPSCKVLDEAMALVDNISMAKMTEGKAREASEAKARRNALHLLVLLAKIWRAALDEDLCELLQPFLVRKDATQV